MNREIRFRGKRIDNGEWVHGDLIHERYGTCIQYTTTINPKGYGAPERKAIIQRHKATVDPATVGQFTGLKDRNGVEIYEGDVVRVLGTEDFGVTELDLDELCVVRYSNENACFYCNVIQKRTISIPLDFPAFYEYDTLPLYQANDEHMHSFEVIGNLHDNPELLEQPSC